MNHDLCMIPTSCAICGNADNSIELFPANFTPQDLNANIFSARRMPDKIHYRLVRCQKCGLVRSDPIVDPETLAELYAKSSQTYDAEVSNLMDSYARYLERATNRLNLLHPGNLHTETLLEIGCGSGFFLERALEYGFQRVVGIEPSRQAVEKRLPDARMEIINDILRPGLLPSGQFSLICMFQVFDHIADPNAFLEECCRALKPGGGILCLNHDVEALSARLMGERSPIIDIEHTYLYSKNTIRQIFSAHGFSVVETGTASNTYSLRYLFQLLPLPKQLKNSLLSMLRSQPAGNIKCTIPLGNLYLIAQK